MANENVVSIILRVLDETKAGFTSPLSNIAALQKSVNQLTPAMAGAAAAVGASLAAMTKHGIDNADEMGKAAQRAAVTSESFSTLAYAAKLADVSREQLGSGMTKLNVALTEAATKGGDIRKALDGAMGSIFTAGGKLKGTDQALMELADHFSKLEDGPQKAALAVQIFGKSGAELLPFLNQGSEGIAALRDEARALGLEISGNTAAAAEAFNDNLTRMHELGLGVSNQLAGEFLPILVQLSSEIVESSKNGGALNAVFESSVFIFKTMAAGVLTLVEALNVVGATIGNTVAIAVTLYKEGPRAAAALYTGFAAEMEKRKEEFRVKMADLFIPQGAAVTAPKEAGRAAATAFVNAAGETLEQQQAKLAEAVARLFGNNAKATQSNSASMLKVADVALKQGTISLEDYYDYKKELAEKDADAQIAYLDIVAQAEERKLSAIDAKTPEFEIQKAAVQKAYQDREAAETSFDALVTVLEAERLERIIERNDAEMAGNRKIQEQWIKDAEEREAKENEMAQRQLEMRQQIEADNAQAGIDIGNVSGGEDRINAVSQYYDQQRVLEDQAYQNRLNNIYKIQQTETDTMVMLEMAYAAHKRKLKAIDVADAAAKKDTQMATLSTYGNILGQGAALAQQFGKKGFLAYQVMAIGQAHINTALAIVKCLADLGPIAGPIAAGAIAAMGAVQVGIIMNQKPTGAAHGGLDYVPAESTYILQQGERILSPNQNSDLVNFLRDQRSPQRSGEVVLNVSGQPLFRLLYQATRSGELVFDARAIA